MKDKLVREWFEREMHDFESARLIFAQEGYYDEIMFLLQQAMERYLKGYLIHNGWELKKIHDIETLLTETMEFDKSFEKFLDIGRKLTVFYYENRYPPGPIMEISREEIVKAFGATEEIFNKIKSKVTSKD